MAAVELGKRWRPALLIGTSPRLVCRFGGSRRSFRATHGIRKDLRRHAGAGLAGHGGLGAVERASDLSMARARGESGGDGDEELGALEVVRRRECLAGAAALAVETNEARDAGGRAQRAVGAIAVEALSAGSVGGAFRPGTEGWIEPRRTHALDGQLRPAHGEPGEQARGRTKATGTRRFAVRRLSDCPPPDTPDDQSINKLEATVGDCPAQKKTGTVPEAPSRSGELPEVARSETAYLITAVTLYW